MTDAEKWIDEIANLLARSITGRRVDWNVTLKTIIAFELREKLLPVLAAGAKCRLVCVNREVAQEYDAAALALAGKKEGV